MEEARANSLRIYFGPGKPEPSEIGIFQFMKTKMRLSPADLLAMDKEPKEHCVYVKFKKEEQMKDALLRLPASMEYFYDKYQSTTVTFSAASGVFKYVRIFNLPPEIEDKEISDVLSKFGIIQRMVRERYGSETGFPIWTSVRGIHMEIQKEIPATIHVRNFQARVYYDGLLNKCFVCGSTEHVKVNCPKRISVNDRLQQSQGSTSTAVRYSDVAADSSRWFPYSRAKPVQGSSTGETGGMVVLGNVSGKRTGSVPTTVDQIEDSENTDQRGVVHGDTMEDHGESANLVQHGDEACDGETRNDAPKRRGSSRRLPGGKRNEVETGRLT